MHKKILALAVCLILVIIVFPTTISITDKINSARNDPVLPYLFNQINEKMVLGYLENITSFGMRKTGYKECVNASIYLVYTFKKMGLDVRKQKWVHGGPWGWKGINIEATIHGTNSSSDKIFIVCAHYDCIVGPGADDDGSGVAAVLAAAKVMSNYLFEHTVKFVLFSGEEQYATGSYYYCKEAKKNSDNIVAALNVDMIGYTHNLSCGKYVKMGSYPTSRWISNLTINLSQKYEDYLDLKVWAKNASYNGDHIRFNGHGYDAVIWHENKTSPHMHKKTDTIANMNITYCTKAVRFITATLIEITGLQQYNAPPCKPIKPMGKTIGKVGINYQYFTNNYDFEDDMIYYRFDWGDGIDTEWFGPFIPGTIVRSTHKWKNPGKYNVSVIAKDNYGKLSSRSEFLTVKIY